MKILITGISGGLGLCLAKEFLASGDEVWGIGRREFKLERADESQQKMFKYDQCDTSKSEQVKFIFNKMIKADYIPDKIIFCAGGATDDVTEKQFQIDRYIDNFYVNLFGILYWVDLFQPYFLKRNRGSFVAVSSMSIYRESRKNRIGYSASKIALNKTFENLCLEYIDGGVEFTIFNLGRMEKKNGLIGISYSKAAARICKIVKMAGYSKQINIPFTQYILTRMVQLIPRSLFKKFLMK